MYAVIFEAEVKLIDTLSWHYRSTAVFALFQSVKQAKKYRYLTGKMRRKFSNGSRMRSMQLLSLMERTNGIKIIPCRCLR